MEMSTTEPLRVEIRRIENRIKSLGFFIRHRNLAGLDFIFSPFAVLHFLACSLNFCLFLFGNVCRVYY